ncbi:MAG: 1-acyl-sn-glycerol-3-phosphate acyltransferase [Chitinivibrionia bacterium]|nr:1-acyl-sn-glycerol-3-phosphate acyltransferase [Chitinivibrionia bacterium]
MFNRILVCLSLGFFVVFCFVMLIPYTIMFLPVLNKQQQRLAYFVQWFCSRFCLFSSGAKVKFTGVENVPKDNIYCIVANHQGMLDIPILMRISPWTLGFITKKELRYLPVLNVWMIALGCIFLDRKSARKAVGVFGKAAKQLQSGHPMAIFPEGTRSKNGEIADFKAGALKLVIKAQVPIVPVSINGSGIVEGRNKSKIVSVVVHPRIEFSEIADMETVEIAAKIRSIIVSAAKKQ